MQKNNTNKKNNILIIFIVIVFILTSGLLSFFCLTALQTNLQTEKNKPIQIKKIVVDNTRIQKLEQQISSLTNDLNTERNKLATIIQEEEKIAKEKTVVYNTRIQELEQQISSLTNDLNTERNKLLK